MLVNFLSEKRFKYDENNNDTTKSKGGKKLKVESGSSVSVENLNALIEESAKSSKGKKRKRKNPKITKNISPTKMVINLGNL